MAKRPTGTRRRPDTSEGEDVFVARVVEFTTWSRKNSQVLILFGVALVVVVVGIMYYVNYRENLSVTAAQELERIHQVRATGNDEPARLQLVQFLERFGDTPYAVEARLTLAQLHLELGDAGQAVEVLEEASVPVTEPIGPQVAILRGRAYEELGRFDDAEQVYLEVADAAGLDFQRTQAMEDAARLRMRRGDAQGAVELYERILDVMDVSNPQRGTVEVRLGEARTRAGVRG
jgi:predicted negative regulator of RcsB-dependent stress response